MKNKVFEYNGCFYANQNDVANKADVIGIEMEMFFAPNSRKFPELCGRLYSITKNSKPSLMQLRKYMREYNLYKKEWFIQDAVEDGVMDELIFVPMSKELIYKTEDQLRDIFTELWLDGYVAESPSDAIGIHHNIEISDLSITDFHRFCKAFVEIRGLLYKVSNRKHLSSIRADINVHIGDRWGLLSSLDKSRKFKAYTEILVQGFKEKAETTLLGVRVYPNHRQLLELMWYNSTFDVDVFFNQLDLTFALKHFSKGKEEVTKRNFLNFVVDHKYDYHYLYKFILNEVEEFSLTSILNNENRIIT